MDQDSSDVSYKAEIERLKAQLFIVEAENRRLQRGCKMYRFMELPFELRSLIWNFALPNRRVLRIAQLPACEDSYISGPIFFCSAGPPAILHACQESRHIALEHFRPFFEKKPGDAEISRPIYFRPKIDILYIDSYSIIEIAEYPEVNEVESVAIRCINQEPYRMWLHGTYRQDHCWTGMTRLLLVTNRNSPGPNHCCAVTELSPDPGGRQVELKWSEFFARLGNSNQYVPDIKTVEAVVEKIDRHDCFLGW